MRPRPSGTAEQQESPAQSRGAVRYIQGVVKPLLVHCLEGSLAAVLWFRRLSPAQTSLEELHQLMFSSNQMMSSREFLFCPGIHTCKDYCYIHNRGNKARNGGWCSWSALVEKLKFLFLKAITFPPGCALFPSLSAAI